MRWCAVQCSAVLYTAVKVCDVRLGPFPGRNWLYSKALHFTSVQCRSLHCSGLYCIAVHWTVFSAVIYCTAHCKPVCMSTSSSSTSWRLLYLEYFFHIKIDLRLVIVDRNKLHFTSFKYLSFLSVTSRQNISVLSSVDLTLLPIGWVGPIPNQGGGLKQTTKL